MPAWYDIKEMDIDRHVDEEQLQQSAAAVHALIDREIERGIDSSRIIVAGFSQGGAVSFEAGLTYAKPLAGIMALSTYFATADSIKVNPYPKRHADIGLPRQHGSSSCRGARKEEPSYTEKLRIRARIQQLSDGAFAVPAADRGYR